MVDFCIATEDELSEAVAEQLVHAAGHRVIARIPKDRRRHGGFGYLRGRLESFIGSCLGGLNFLLLTDLDTKPCAPALIDEWFAGKECPERLLFRVAVRETESWLLADGAGVAKWLNIQPTLVGDSPDTLPDPKRHLLGLAGKSPVREIKLGMLPKKGAPSLMGLEYNDLTCRFVRERWSLDHAAERSPSLRRTVERLRGIG